MEEQQEPKDKYTGAQAVGCLFWGVVGIFAIFLILFAIGWVASGS
jgi:hypothetical protein